MKENEMKAVTDWLIENVFQNTDIMFDDAIWNQEIKDYGRCFDLIDVIASLHNLLYKEVHGESYDYMFHWCNKIGADCIEDIFETIILNSDTEQPKDAFINDNITYGGY